MNPKRRVAIVAQEEPHPVTAITDWAAVFSSTNEQFMVVIGGHRNGTVLVNVTLKGDGAFSAELFVKALAVLKRALRACSLQADEDRIGLTDVLLRCPARILSPA